MEKIHKSTIFLFLYTTQDANWNWCIHEAGIFRGSKRTIKGHLICIKNSNIKEFVEPIDHLQAYDSKENNIKTFLQDLLYDGKFTDNEKINPELFTDFNNEFISAYKDISRQFESKPVTIDYLPRRLKIGPIERVEGEKPKLEGAPISGNRETLGIFDLGEGIPLTWEDLYNRFHTESSASWIDNLVSASEGIFKRTN